FGLDGPGHLLGLDLRLEALNDLAVAADEELGEVPFRVAPTGMGEKKVRSEPFLLWLASKTTATRRKLVDAILPPLLGRPGECRQVRRQRSQNTGAPRPSPAVDNRTRLEDRCRGSRTNQASGTGRGQKSTHLG